MEAIRSAFQDPEAGCSGTGTGGAPESPGEEELAKTEGPEEEANVFEQ